MLEDYLKSRKNEKEISSLMKPYWKETMEGPFEGSHSNPALFGQIKEAMEADRHHRTQHKLKVYTWGLRAAAVLLLALISSSIFYMQKKQDLLSRQWHSVTTPFGAKTIITLPDSSTIWLNAGSSLKYSNEFGRKNREVHLSGEAFFDVFHEPALTFSGKDFRINHQVLWNSF